MDDNSDDVGRDVHRTWLTFLPPLLARIPKANCNQLVRLQIVGLGQHVLGVRGCRNGEGQDSDAPVNRQTCVGQETKVDLLAFSRWGGSNGSARFGRPQRGVRMAVCAVPSGCVVASRDLNMNPFNVLFIILIGLPLLVGNVIFRSLASVFG